jgi:5-methylcytosine-specific restriction endonuclease McrA
LKEIRANKRLLQKNCCYWCGLPMAKVSAADNPLRCTADHLVPRFRGGGTNLHNVVAAHASCNQDRQKKGRPGYYLAVW